MSGSGLILAIETTNPTADAARPGVAVARSADGPVEVEHLRAGRARGGHDDDLMPAIDRLLGRIGGAARDIGVVCVSVGPGGYTGLRVACAAGKMIAEGAGARCVAVPTALVVARRVPPSAWEAGGGGGVAVALASKGKSAWVQVVDPAAATPTGRLMTAADLGPLADAGVRTLVADRHLPEPMRAEAARLEMQVIEPVFDPAACIEAWRVYGLPLIDPAELVPLYPREPDAVTQWRARMGGGAGHG